MAKMLDKNNRVCSLLNELSLNEKISRIPKTFLNSIGFINYDHHGNFPWTSSDEEEGNVFLSSEYKRVTPVLGIDCEMVGIGSKKHSALGRVSIVNEYGYCVYDTFVKPQEKVTDYRTKYSGIRPEDLVDAPATDVVLKKVTEIVHDKILVGHAIHNDLEVLNLKDHQRIRDTAIYFKMEFDYQGTPSLKELAKNLLNFDIQIGEHSSIQDAQATLKLYLEYREQWERDIAEGRNNANLPAILQSGKIVKNISEMHIAPRESDLFEDSKNIFLRENKVVGAYSTCEEYLDIQFRLLLEDFLRPLRDGVQNVNQLLKNTKSSLFHDAEINTEYDKVEIEGKLNFCIPIVRNHLMDTDWKETKIFLNGSLLLLTLDNFKSVKFAVITNRSEDQTNSHFVTMKVKILKDGPTWLINSDKKFLVMESPAFYEAYKHSLKYLQKVQLKKFPMTKYIVNAETKSKPPAYLQSVTKELDFSVLLKNKEDNVKMAKPLEVNNWPKANELNFDASQYEAFWKAVTQEMTIIQGPPGTGKTFIGIQIVKLLLSNPWLLDSPILIVSQRNHSLDQALEIILDFVTGALCAGYKKTAEKMILRIGYGSKSDIVQPLTLNYKTQSQFRKEFLLNKHYALEKLIYTLSELNFEYLLLEHGILDFQKLPLEMLQELSSHEKYAIVFSKWRNIEDEMKKDPLKWFGIQFRPKEKKALKTNLPSKHTRNLFLCSFHQYNISWPIHHFEIRNNILSNSIEKFYPLPDIQPEVEESHQILKYATRWTYYLLLVKGVKEIVENVDKKMLDIEQEYSETETSIISRTESINLAKVIGMTTTGAVKHKGIVLKAKPKIMIVEEAAHVLEAHVVASLTEHCQQMVLIGDHKQLRPLTADYNLATDYKLDVSLMERLVGNGIAQGVENWTQLKVQHRMRPEIARMICPVIYEELDNHPDVYNYPDVNGCSTNLFFVDHRNPERRERGSRSYFNEYEASFVCGLIKYFVKGGYCHLSQIAIIATYSAQKILIENELKSDQDKSYSQVRVSTVDGFQGEENDIIILSLVRNNEQGNVGFLKTDNRVCVALSRARHGLFIIGNMSSLKEKSGTWEKVNATLEELHCIGDSLPLTGTGFEIKPLTVKAKNLFARPIYQNQNPPNNPKPNQYAKQTHKIIKPVAPIHQQKNVQVLKCGHSQALTERQMKNVSAVKCTTTVDKKLPCGHQQKVHCHQTTGFICSRMVKKLLICGHSINRVCNRELSDVKCTKIVIKKLVCGHEQKVSCHQAAESRNKCDVITNVTWSCGHQKKVPCHEKSLAICDVLVKKALTCGHEIELSCSDQVPENCPVIIESILQCDHLQKHPCHLRDTVECSLKISRKLPCGHEQKLLCSDKHLEIQCNVLVTSKCKHKIEMKCHAARIGLEYCRRKCDKKFKCGHRCSLLCHDINQHSEYDCIEKCQRSCINGHPCPGDHECYKNCPVRSKNGCQKVISSCSHEVIKCHGETNSISECKIRCKTIFSCGHQCRLICHEKDDPKHFNYSCIEQCQKSCPFDHPCTWNHTCRSYCPLTSKISHSNRKTNCLVCLMIQNTIVPGMPKRDI